GLVVQYGRADWLAISPLRIILVWSAAVVLGLWRMEQSRGALLLAGGFLMLAVLGHTAQAMRRHVEALGVDVRRILSAAIPSAGSRPRRRYQTDRTPRRAASCRRASSSPGATCPRP